MTFIPVLLHYVVESKPLAAFLSGSKDMDRDSRADALGKDKNIGWCIADIFKTKAAKKLSKEQQALIAKRASELEHSDCLGWCMCTQLDVLFY